MTNNNKMHLADFILANIEPILAEWQTFAGSIWPGSPTDPATLRDHAEQILRATALDMKSHQTEVEQADKAKGRSVPGDQSREVNRASVQHSVARVDSGFDLNAMVSEYRALRASVLRLWQKSLSDPHLFDLDDLTRFNESIDQSLTEAIRGFAAHTDLLATQLAVINDSSDDAIIGKGVNGIITSWNRGAERIFGYTAQEAIGQHINLIVPTEKRLEEAEVLRRLLSGEAIKHFETERLTKDGQLRQISLTTWPIKDIAGKVVGASKVARDVTDKKRAADELQHAREDAERANRAKDVFLATLSHELRTPLAAIVGWTQLLRRSVDNPETVREGLDVIERNTKTQLKLMDDVLDVARIVSGKMRLEMEDCRLAEIIDTSVASVRPSAEERNITLDVTTNTDTNVTSCDPVRMQQVIWNLLTNAIKFTPPGGTVRVTLDSDDRDVKIAVSDTGKGISADLLAHVFERYRQAESSTLRRFGGLGLGLSIVKYVIEAHGGTIHAASDGENLGATFSIQLPVKPALSDDALSVQRQPERNV